MSDTLRFNCPGCGSELETPEGTISNRCRFCGLTSRLGQPGRVVKQYYETKLDDQGARFMADRHLKDSDRPLLSKVHWIHHLYIPFYRFRGLSLTCLSRTKMEVVPTLGPDGIATKSFELRAKNLDLTTLACSKAVFGMVSLGIRPQAVPTYAYRDAEIPATARVIPADISPAQGMAAALKMDHATIANTSEETGGQFSEMIGEAQSLIYFPVHIVSGDYGGQRSTLFVDGLAKRVYWETHEPWEIPETGPAALEITDLRPEPHHCPNCGADFEPSERSLYYLCRNCDRSWFLDRNGYQQIEHPPVAGGDGPLYPFWRLPLAFDQPRTFATVGDFARLLTADIPLLAAAKQDQPFYLYIPAFAGSDAEWQLQTAVRLTRTQPLTPPAGRHPDQSPAVVLPQQEALEFAAFAWDWLRMSYLNLRTDRFSYTNAQSGTPELIWLPLTDARLRRSIKRVRQAPATQQPRRSRV